MKSVFAAIALFVSLALADSSSFSINTPSNVVECQPTLVSWSGGTQPFYLSILPGSSPNGNAIESFPAINATQITWQVNIQSGTSIGLTLRDSSGLIAQTAAVTVQSGSDASCLSSTSYAVGGATSGSSGASSTPGGASASQTTAGGTTAASSASSGASATSTSNKSGASANGAQLGAAAMAGVALGALFF